MLKFFRRIRHQLLTESKFSKYLLYAIGEIILVVIGILIALQINTWNSERNARGQELSYLQEINANLDKDLIDIERVLQFNREKDSAINKGFEIMANTESNEAKAYAFSALFELLTTYEVFEPVRIAFDNMTDYASINLVSDAQLRQQLSQYYGYDNYSSGTQERIKEQTRVITDEVAPLLLTKEAVKMYTSYDFDFPSAADNEFYKNTMVFSHLFTMKMVMQSQNWLLEDAREQIKGQQNRIDAILKEAE